MAPINISAYARHDRKCKTPCHCERRKWYGQRDGSQMERGNLRIRGKWHRNDRFLCCHELAATTKRDDPQVQNGASIGSSIKSQDRAGVARLVKSIKRSDSIMSGFSRKMTKSCRTPSQCPAFGSALSDPGDKQWTIATKKSFASVAPDRRATQQNRGRWLQRDENHPCPPRPPCIGPHL